MSNVTIDVLDYTLVVNPEWEGRLKAAKQNLAKRTIPAYIEFCQEVHEFRKDCDASRGGSEFSKRGCEWLGCSSRQLHYWASVGRRAPELCTASAKLPVSERAIADIASLDDIHFPQALERLEPDMTQKQVKELIKEVNPPPVKTSVEVDTAHDQKARRILKAIKTLPQGYQRGIWIALNGIFKEEV